MAVPTFEDVTPETTSQCDRNERTTVQESHEQRPESTATSNAKPSSPLGQQPLVDHS
jgi:hypothetical protein